MANGRIKTEMGKKPGSRGRWMLRADAKKYADKARRKEDVKAEKEW